MKFQITCILVLLTFIASAFFYLTTIPIASAITTETWNQTSGNLASTDANWLDGTAPGASADTYVIFDGTSTASCTWDLAITIGNLNLNSGYTGVLTLGANVGVADFTMAAGTLTGSASYTLTVSGNFAQTAGTVTANLLKLTMTGTSKTFSIATANYLYNATFSGSVTHNAGEMKVSSLYVSPTGTLTTNGYILWYPDFGYSSISNKGTIDGTGSLKVQLIENDKTLSFGITKCNIEVYATPGATANRTVTLSGDQILGSGTSNFIRVTSSHATYYTTLSTGSYSLTCAWLRVGTRGIIMQGNGIMTCGIFWVESATSSVTQGATISTGDVVISEGTITPSTIYNWICNGNFTHTGGTFTSAKLNLILTGIDKTLDVRDDISWYFHNLTFNGTTEIDSATRTMALCVNADVQINADCYHWNLWVASGATMSIAINMHYYPATTYEGNAYDPAVFSNLGTIDASSPTGYYAFQIGHVNISVDPGYIACKTYIVNSPGTGNSSFTFIDDGIFGGELLIASEDDFGLIFVDGNGYDVIVNNTLKVGGGAVVNTGEGIWTIGGYEQYVWGYIGQADDPRVYVEGQVIAEASTMMEGTLFFTESARWTCEGNFSQTGGFIDDANVDFSSGDGVFNQTNGTIDALHIFMTNRLLWTTIINGSVNSTTFTIEGLKGYMSYRAYVDGQMIAIGDGPTFTFIYEGNWSSHEFSVEEWYPTPVSLLVILTINMLAVGLMVGVIGMAITPLKDSKNRTPEKMVRIVINVVVCIVVGIVLITMVNNMFLGG